MNEQYHADIIAALADRTIKRLCIVIIALCVLFVGSNIAWFCYVRSHETVIKEVYQKSVEGKNYYAPDGYCVTPDNQENK